MALLQGEPLGQLQLIAQGCSFCRILQLSVQDLSLQDLPGRCPNIPGIVVNGKVLCERTGRGEWRRGSRAAVRGLCDGRHSPLLQAEV